MLRGKAPSGIMTGAQYRVLGELSLKFGRDYTELSTRQNVQLHWLQIKDFPEVFAALDAVGLTSLGGCGDSVRNITGCPAPGPNAANLSDCPPHWANAAENSRTGGTNSARRGSNSPPIAPSPDKS